MMKRSTCTDFVLCIFLASHILPIFAANCSIPPLVLPLKNNTLADGVALNRGVPVQIGGQPEGMRYCDIDKWSKAC
jgi:hypothetical protein